VSSAPADEVLGAIESGVDFEKRITTSTNAAAKPRDQDCLHQLQLELSFEINER